MSSYLSALHALTPDPLLDMMARAGADMRAEKIDVSVGVYRNDAGVTPVMDAVREAERRLAAGQATKAYEGQRGNTDFCAAIERFCLGDDLRADLGERLVSYATPGGCGALWAGMAVARHALPDGRVWISAPTWINHRHIAAAAGFEALEYRYWDPASQTLDFDGFVASLTRARAGDIVILQGPCHNPTGADLTDAQWLQLAAVFEERALIAFLDIAYHGFGAEPEADLFGPRLFMERQSEFFVSYSCSKNFGLYRERAGCLLAVCDDRRAANRTALHIADATRAVYSMPPAHGQAVVNAILTTPGLRRTWSEELTAMRRQIEEARRGLHRALTQMMNTRSFSFLTDQKGMFSILPLRDGAGARLRESRAVYMPGSGRINFAALNNSNIERFAEALAGELAD